MLHSDGVDRNAHQCPIAMLWDDIIPIKLARVDVWIESLTLKRGQTGEYIGRAGPAVVHVDQETDHHRHACDARSDRNSEIQIGPCTKGSEGDYNNSNSP